MCQECRQELSRRVRLGLIVLIFGIGIPIFHYVAVYHDDLLLPFREHHVKKRLEQIKQQLPRASVKT